MADAAQNISPEWDRTDIKFRLEPDIPGTIDFTKIIVELQSDDGLRVIKTLTSSPPAGLTIDATGINVAFAADAVDGNSKPLFKPGQIQFEARDTTTADRSVVAWGHLPIRTTG